MKKKMVLATALLWAGLSFAAVDVVQFMNSIERDGVSAVQKILAEGQFNANTLNYEGHTALYVALREPAPRVADVLIDNAQTKLNLENKFGENALMMAAMRGLLPQAQRMVAKGAEVNKKGWTPLHYAASAGDVAMVKFLLDASAYIDAESPTGDTPLMMAASRAKLEVLQLLLDEGADASLRNAAGQDAVDMALAGSNTKSAALLRNWSAASASARTSTKTSSPTAEEGTKTPAQPIIAQPAAGNEAPEEATGTTFTGTGTGRP